MRARARMSRSEAFRSFEETVTLIKIARVHLAPYITITRRRHGVLAITKINCVPRNAIKVRVSLSPPVSRRSSVSRAATSAYSIMSPRGNQFSNYVCMMLLIGARFISDHESRNKFLPIIASFIVIMSVYCCFFFPNYSSYLSFG